ncbi:protein of unknown function [Paraburkholderia dioscoreae]|uniref:Uncharacterized protein n=1 Tax=Paraburkholderia dioscoreae TaxID=2604047 RepID=A0A5Q4ZIB3_9BURK|nr:protein of unknown function [Paraburkholderia dioscoreae]
MTGYGLRSVALSAVVSQCEIVFQESAAVWPTADCQSTSIPSAQHPTRVRRKRRRHALSSSLPVTATATSARRRG